LSFNFSKQCEPSAVKNWARQVCLRENSFDSIVAKLSEPRAQQYADAVVGVEELQGKRRKWTAYDSSVDPLPAPADVLAYHHHHPPLPLGLTRYVVCHAGGPKRARKDDAHAALQAFRRELFPVFYCWQEVPTQFEYNGKLCQYDPAMYGGPVLVPMNLEDAANASKHLPYGLPSLKTTCLMLQCKWFKLKFSPQTPPSNDTYLEDMKGIEQGIGE